MLNKIIQNENLEYIHNLTKTLSLVETTEANTAFAYRAAAANGMCRGTLKRRWRKSV